MCACSLCARVPVCARALCVRVSPCVRARACVCVDGVNARAIHSVALSLSEKKAGKKERRNNKITPRIYKGSRKII